jgi:hypothetical protein
MNSKQWNWPDCVWRHMALCLTVLSWWWGLLCVLQWRRAKNVAPWQKLVESIIAEYLAWLRFCEDVPVILMSTIALHVGVQFISHSCLASHVVVFGTNVLALHLMVTIRNFSHAIGRPCCDIWNQCSAVGVHMICNVLSFILLGVQPEQVKIISIHRRSRTHVRIILFVKQNRKQLTSRSLAA